MKSLQLLFAQPLAADLGWTLLHFVWQGALISGLFAAVRGLGAGSTSARARYALACLTLATMASAPILTYGFLAGSDTLAIGIRASPCNSGDACSLGWKLGGALVLVLVSRIAAGPTVARDGLVHGCSCIIDSLGGWFVCRSSPAVQCKSSYASSSARCAR